MLALSRRTCACGGMGSRLLSRRDRLHGIGTSRDDLCRRRSSTTARSARSTGSRRLRLGERTRAPRFLDREWNAPPRRRCTSGDVRRSALAGQPRPILARPWMVADARRDPSRRVRGLSRRRAGGRCPRRRAERSILHELPWRAERSARMRHVSRGRCARIPATLAMLLPRDDGGSCPCGPRGAERLARHRPSVLDLSSGASRRKASWSARQRLRRRVVRLRSRRPRRALRRGEQELHWHVSCSHRRRASFTVVDCRHADDVQRLPFFPAARALPGPLHDVSSRGKRRRDRPRDAVAAHQWQGRPRRRERQVWRVPRSG